MSKMSCRSDNKKSFTICYLPWYTEQAWAHTVLQQTWCTRVVSRENAGNLTICSNFFDDKTKELTAQIVICLYGSWCKPTTSQNQCIKRYSRALQWMPRRILPMKDVEDCDNLRGAVNKLRSGGLRMGKPAMSHVMCISIWIHRIVEREPPELKHLSRARKRK